MKRLKINAQLVYLISISWLGAAVGCFVQNVGIIGGVAAGVGALHLVYAIWLDRKESKQSKTADAPKKGKNKQANKNKR